MATPAWLQKGSIQRPKEQLKDAAAQSEKAQPGVSMYTALPDGEVAIEEFERFATDRLRVLKGIEDARTKGISGPQLSAEALKLDKQFLQGATREETARKDSVSHYVLRLAYCRTDELRRWFLAQECELFKARFTALAPSQQRDFMAGNNLPFKQLGAGELDGELRQKLAETARAVTGQASSYTAVAEGDKVHEQFYKVPFEMVPDLVATRRVFLRTGFAFVPRDSVVSLVVQPFRASLSKALVVTARRWAAVIAPEEADRLTPIVEGLSQRYLGPDYGDPERRGVVGAVAAADIPALARQSFPLCMLSMYQSLHDTHDLKHEGRQQLGLFLKGIGLPLEEAIRFWRSEFALKAPGEKFDKQYLYNIRHNYGKEGKRTDYTPYSCMRVISTTPGVGMVHGCPYKTFAPDSLRAALTRLQVSPPKVEEAVSKAKAGHYQLACAAAWEGKHGCACETGINHPNQYYEESRKALGAPLQAPAEAGEGAAAAAAGGSTPAAAGAAGAQSVPASALRGEGSGGGGGDAQTPGGGPAAKVQRTS